MRAYTYFIEEKFETLDVVVVAKDAKSAKKAALEEAKRMGSIPKAATVTLGDSIALLPKGWGTKSRPVVVYAAWR